MPTDEQNTAELTTEQKELLGKLGQPEGHGLPAGGKDPANAEAFKPYRKREFPDDDKVW